MKFPFAQLRQTLQTLLNIKYRIRNYNNKNKYTITTSNIIKYIWDNNINGFCGWSITLDEMTEIPQDMHKKICDKTIRNGAHCLILVYNGENDSKIHILYKMPKIKDGQTRDYINILYKNHPDVKEHIIYAYFI
jgi:hypothetical protein